MEMPKEGKKVTFIEGIKTYCGAGQPDLKDGLSIHQFSCNANMEKTAFFSADGDLMIVPQEGSLLVKTELGLMKVSPQEICVV